MRLPSVLALSCALLGCARPATTPPSGAALGAPAWDRLKQVLPGAWSTPAKTGSFGVSYKLISGGSALVEAWGAGTPNETETVIYPDHEGLLLTHFCAQGNQPRLRVVDLSSDAVVFRFVDVTNRMPDQAMLVERTLRFVGDSFEDTEVYAGADGKEERTTSRFTRVAASPR